MHTCERASVYTFTCVCVRACVRACIHVCVHKKHASVCSYMSIFLCYYVSDLG